MKTKKPTSATLLRDTVCFSGNFIKGARPGEIKTGERVKITERIECSLVSGKPRARIETRDGRWAWVAPSDLC